MASEGVEEVEDMETEMSPEAERERDTPSPQVDSPKRGSEMEGSPDYIQPRILLGNDEGYVEELQEIEDGETHGDPTCSEGILKCRISGVSDIDSKLLSPPIFIRNLPWRLLVMARESTTPEGLRIKSIGIFVQCNPKSPESASWNVAARAVIRLVSHEAVGPDHCKEIFHCFCARENDWGFSNYMAWKEMMDESKGYVQNNSIVVHVEIVADAPHGINWDSRKYTGFVGLKNQGATCYMNSLLQTLYCTNKLRQAVYMMPTENDDPIKSVPLALQRLFYELQHSDKPVGTRKLTKSFGWDTMDIFMQHDVQELSRVLLDNIESKMKNTVVEGTISGLFEGKMESFIRCKHVDYESTRVETFFDIQLNIKDKKDVYESFKDYVRVESMDGENKYDAGEHGLQEAKKGVVFLTLPPVLHLHLMRFQYDPITDANIKINDRYMFPAKLTLGDFLKEPEATPANYSLLAVLVHSGDNYGGHYVVYINPIGRGKWLKFDDDVVSTCSAKEAIDQNFGGSDDTLGIRNCTNAYMLVYVRDSSMPDVLQEVTDKDVGKALISRFAQEKELEMVRRKERNEAHLYMTVDVYVEDDFQSHQGPDLLDFDDVKPKSFRILKTQTLAQFRQHLAANLGYPVGHIRIWPFEKRSNFTCRPSFVEKDESRTVFQHADCKQPWKVFVETLPADARVKAFDPYDDQSQVLLFFKYYNPMTGVISYMGHYVEFIVNKLANLIPLLREWAGLSNVVPLIMFERNGTHWLIEHRMTGPVPVYGITADLNPMGPMYCMKDSVVAEVKPSLVERVDPNVQLCNVEDLRDGDIICYQRADLQFDKFVVPTVDEYFRELYNRCDIAFYDRCCSSDPGFTLTLSQRMSYHEMAKAVGEHLDVDSKMLQFFRPQLTAQRNFSQLPIRSTVEGCLRDFVRIGSKSHLDTPPMLSYQVLPLPVEVFENKKCFRCIFVNRKLREEKELSLYVDKNGTVQDILDKAMKEVTLGDDSTKSLRLLEVMTNRIVEVFSPEKPVSDLLVQRVYRIEEIRQEEMHLKSTESLIPVSHFQKAMHNLFGVPFLMKIYDGESLSSITDRIHSLLDIGDNEFEKWKFAVLEAVAPPHYFDEGDTLTFSQFLLDPSKGIRFPRMGIPLLGIDHINKAPKRSRHILEKAIKIHN